MSPPAPSGPAILVPKATEEAASGLWRSEDMTMIEFHMQREAAHDSVLRLGQLGLVQFLDLNKHINAFQRDFAGDIRRTDELDRKIRFLQEEIRRSGIAFVNLDSEIDELSVLEKEIDEKTNDVRELNNQYEQLVAEHNSAREQLEVICHTRVGSNMQLPQTASNSGLNVFAGVIPKDKLEVFERLIYRVTRGQSIMRVDDIEEHFENPVTGTYTYKNVFALFFGSGLLRDKLKKICDSCGANVYPHCTTAEEARQKSHEVQERLDQLHNARVQNEVQRRKILSSVAQYVNSWRSFVITEKGIFSVMNMLQFHGTMVTARGWTPLADLDNVTKALREAEATSGAQVRTIVTRIATKEKHPTYFRTNKFTETFQGIVDSYGVARYKEANPGVFTIVTFPYLFGVMFGDVGHGLILTLAAAFMIFIEKNLEGKPLNEIVAMVFGGRYLIFLMGLFATYIGILYNDMFGFSTEMFTSGYSWPDLPPNGPSGIVHPMSPNGVPNVKPANAVVFGIDSAWSETENKLEFYNSLKMKCAVTIGIIQMTLGIFISMTNYIYDKDWKHLWFRFVPEIIFQTCTFGYMALMIVIKWVTPWPNTNLAPSLLETMTNFFLAPGTVTTPLYNGQATVQVILLLIALVQVPILLAVVPYLENKHHNELVEKARKRHEQNNAAHEGTQLRAVKTDSMAPVAAAAASTHHDDDEEEEIPHFDFSEIMIHQVIHTIEFVLGCISNTASYLRLWALSLAHAQLSDVFWNFAFLKTVGLDNGSGIFIFLGFAVWISATLGVLLGMESLSAFLHALRLHWVEFQGKFYRGDGVQFQPFDVDELERNAAVASA